MLQNGMNTITYHQPRMPVRGKYIDNSDENKESINFKKFVVLTILIVLLVKTPHHKIITFQSHKPVDGSLCME